MKLLKIFLAVILLVVVYLSPTVVDAEERNTEKVYLSDDSLPDGNYINCIEPVPIKAISGYTLHTDNSSGFYLEKLKCAKIKSYTDMPRKSISWYLCS